MKKYEPNAIDKVVAFFSPQSGARRMAARMQMEAASSSWAGASGRRSLSGWGVEGSSVDADSANANGEMETLRGRTRDLARNSPLAGGAVSTVCTNVVGPGLRMVPQVNAKRLGLTSEQADEWNDKVREEFDCWAESPLSDAARVTCFYDQQALVFRSYLESGDVFVNMPRFRRGGIWPYRLTIQTLEADRVSNPSLTQDTVTMVQGVEKNERGEHVAYHISKHHPGNTLYFKERVWARHLAHSSVTGRKLILHLARRTRPEQTRGVPYLAPVIEHLKQLTRYTEAELMAAVVSGMFTALVKTTDANGLGAMLPTAETGAESGDEEYKLGNGAIVSLATGEEVEFGDPGRPNAKFDGFVMSVLRQVGVGLEIPYEILIKHFTASYSASRAALVEAWKVFRMRRQWLAMNLCQPVYEAFLEDLITSGRISAPGFFNDPLIRKAWATSKWVGPGRGQIDELKEVQAVEKRLAIGLTTMEDETMELNGGDFKRNLERRAAEKEAVEAAGLGASAAPPPEGPGGEEDDETGDSDLESPPQPEEQDDETT